MKDVLTYLPTPQPSEVDQLLPHKRMPFQSCKTELLNACGSGNGVRRRTSDGSHYRLHPGQLNCSG
ncbi:hypothetical protein B7R56_13955 [Pseudomonas savastanoi pv. retacarpa]|nr:hypothetical protein [Pseudomonas savastanoi]OSR27840.1 hypothetical protein B7R56_13955 [Pseudomonas savastanoi pv. retacarpa]